MINSFDVLLEQVNIVEDTAVEMKVGLYPGAFKPPHIGHYQAAKLALQQNDIVFVLVSGMCRGTGCESVDTNQSTAIWQLYKNDIGDPNLKIVPIDTWTDPDSNNKSTVITATYDIIHLLNNNGEYESTGRFLQAHPSAKKVYNYLRTNNSFSVSVYAGVEDFKGRYSGLPFDGVDHDNRYIGNDVVDIRQGKPPRIASARNIRPHIAGYRRDRLTTTNSVREKILAGAIKYDDFASVRKNLPGDDTLKDQVIDILLR